MTHETALAPSAASVCSKRWNNEALQVYKDMATSLGNNGNNNGVLVEVGYSAANPNLCLIDLMPNAPAAQELSTVLQFNETANHTFTQGASGSDAQGFAANATIHSNGNITPGLAAADANSAPTVTTSMVASKPCAHCANWANHVTQLGRTWVLCGPSGGTSNGYYAPTEATCGLALAIGRAVDAAANHGGFSAGSKAFSVAYSGAKAEVKCAYPSSGQGLEIECSQAGHPALNELIFQD